MVEFVLALPFVVTLMFALVQLGLVFADYLRVTDAARVGARAAAVARFANQAACPAAVGAVPPDLASGLTCSGSGSPGSPFTVRVRIERTLELPLLPFSSTVNLKGTATERIE